ncbi:MAG TPA: hypothetical protein VF795_03440 [Desulfuromonadaceae bacterium]
MAEKLRLKIPLRIAALVQPEGAVDEKLKGLGEASGLASEDRVLLIFCLMQDRDDVVKGAAGAAFAALAPEVLVEFIRCRPDTPAAVLDVIARIHHSSPAVAGALLNSRLLSPGARIFLQRFALGKGGGTVPTGGAGGDGGAEPGYEPSGGDEEPVEEDSAPEESGDVDEEGEEFLSKYRLSQSMGIADKIKMALTGDKEWRALLVKDSNKLVSGSVMKNPRITEAEVLSVVKSGVQNDEIMRLICANKEWIKNIKIRKALVENPRTPVPNALRYLSTLSEKDIATYAKSKNISSVVSTQARRLLLNKKRS